jgi:hypothetical protein
MRILFNTQADNQGKHELMPAEYPYHIYEFENESPGMNELIMLGYFNYSVEEFETYKSGFDISAYEAAIAPTAIEVGKEALRKIKEICDDLVDDFKIRNQALGIAPPITGEVTLYLHKLNHYLEAQATSEAVNEIDRLIGVGTPTNLAPFITETALTEFKMNLIYRLSTLV